MRKSSSMKRRRLIEGESSDDSADSTFQLDDEFVSIKCNLSNYIPLHFFAL